MIYLNLRGKTMEYTEKYLKIIIWSAVIASIIFIALVITCFFAYDLIFLGFIYLGIMMIYFPTMLGYLFFRSKQIEYLNRDDAIKPSEK